MDDLLRHGHALELGVSPNSEAMAGWEPSAEDQVALLGEKAKALRDADEAVFATTWDSEPQPGSMAELAVRLQEVPDAVDRLRELAARSGAEMALTMVMSWFTRGFDEAGLKRIFYGFREGTNFDQLRQ